MDPEIQQAAALLFARRRGSLTLVESSGDASSSSSMARGAHVAELGRELEEHCRRVLSDYIALLELFDALHGADSNGTRETFHGYVEDAASELCQVTGIQARGDRNRVFNRVSSIKSEADAELARVIELATRASALALADGGDALDDRLPLRRRGAFDRDLERLASDAKRVEGAFSLVMVDIDHFKRVNDEHGHPVGDEVLLAVAQAVVDRVAHKGTAYRYGGEEFALLLPSYSLEEACGLAERIRKDIEGMTVSSKELGVTASFGVASFPAHATDARTLLERADTALYDAKVAGRNRVQG